MRSDCRRIEEALAEGRPLNDTELEHVESCARCRRVTDELSRLDEELPNLLPEVPEGLAERTIAAVEQAEPRRDGGRAFLARRVLVAAATFLLVGVVFVQLRGRLREPLGMNQSVMTQRADYPIAEREEIATEEQLRELKRMRDSSAGSVRPSSALEGPEIDASWEGRLEEDAAPGRDLAVPAEEEGAVLFHRSEAAPPAPQLEDKKRELRRASERERKVRAEAQRQEAAEAARRKAELERLARAQAERDRLARIPAMKSTEPPPPSAPARGLSSKDQRASQAPPASRGPAEAPGDELDSITGGFQAEYGEQSTGIAEIVMEDRVAHAEGEDADFNYSTGSFAAYPDADGRSSMEKAKARKADVGESDAFDDELGARLNAPVGQTSHGVGGAPFADPNAKPKAALFDSLGKNESEGENLAQDAPGQAKGLGLDGQGRKAEDLQALAQARAKSIEEGTPKLMQSAGSFDLVEARMRAARGDLIEQMGFGALGYEPEDWKGVSLDRPVYFENTYLGGNARMAWLDRRASSLRLAGELVAPHRVVGLPEQPFDAPERGAVALHVDASEAHVTAGEARRVFLQVGIAGTEDAAWRRPPASVVVLPLLSDTREAELSATIATLRAGLEERDLLAFAQESEAPVFASPEEAGTESVGVTPDHARKVLRGLAKAYAGVEGGASMRTRRLVILADRPVGDDVRRQVHRLAVADVVTTVVSVGARGETLDSHAAIAQAGQGNLHLAAGSDGVASAIDDELDSLTRVVARALRLNIRPAEGVRLIQVLGSRPLGKREVKEVKAREKAVDRAVERTTGIGSDRGADDPGLQTVLPYFLAGDRHVVIVELEVDGPGPLADVSLKVKDLVEMENRSLRASAALSRTPAERTPRQLQVRRNVAGFAVAKILHEAEVQLAAGGSAHPGRLRALAEQLLADPLIASEADARLLEIYARILQNEKPDRWALAASIECARLARLGRATP